MKIAAISDDGVTISQHFGRAPLYVIATVEDDKVVHKENRPKSGHHTFAAHHADTKPGERHGYDAGAQVRHANMVSAIADCQVLVAGGMGWGAYESLKDNNIEPIVTDVKDIDEAVKRYLDGKLDNLMERLH
ncbi:MAG TPA: dinitrogenase iron-molybdenum cofactor biosynthesis protein [Dehalococcoidia bacterium]|nr:MAG: dinitrogenase iron-molybdenum cofactor biosynthesis protein [Coxiella sp. DG_40]HEY50438.1 dinitrogenase iron-molybdenum cofactor biosynthesis protein [Dehalococcoidia bacterium]